MKTIPQIHRTTFLALTVFLTASAAMTSQKAEAGNQQPIDSTPAVQEFFLNRVFDLVDKTQAEQPYWITPIFTVTPRLQEQFRYDQFWERRPNGVHYTSYGGGRGLELIPTENTEIILGVPAWIDRNKPNGSSGLSDESFLLKYRVLSANEENGNYILSLFLGLSVPIGDKSVTQGQTIFTPTIAFGKGWGDFDFQTTIGIAVPAGGATNLGTPIMVNTAFQYRVFKYLWPEFEVNYTYWPSGDREGINQVYLTPGIVLGKFPLLERLGLTVGAGYQFAVTHNPVYRNNVIFSARLPF